MMNRSLLNRLERLEKRTGPNRWPSFEVYHLEADGTRIKLANPNGEQSNGGATLRLLIVDAVDGRPIRNAATAADTTPRKEAS